MLPHHERGLPWGGDHFLLYFQYEKSRFRISLKVQKKTVWSLLHRVEGAMQQTSQSIDRHRLAVISQFGGQHLCQDNGVIYSATLVEKLASKLLI